MALQEQEIKTEELSSVYTQKLDNIKKIRTNLQNIITEIDAHSTSITKGFDDIQSLIDEQRNKFENLSNEWEQTQNSIADKDRNRAETKDETSNDISDVFDFNMLNIEIPPKREPIKVLPFKPIAIDFNLLEKASSGQPQCENDDIKLTDSDMSTDAKMNMTTDEDEDEDEEEVSDVVTDEDMFDETEQATHIMSAELSLPKDVISVLGKRKEWKLPKKKKDKAKMERDLRKITVSLADLGEKQRKYAKLSILKYYDILFETYRKYCKIGGDSDWLTQKGWNALYKDAFIADNKSGQCKDADIKSLFTEIYNSHHSNSNKTKKNKHIKNMMTTALNVSEWNDSTPWSGIWKQCKQDNTAALEGEEYILKQVGDNKLVGFIKDFQFCDISGAINTSKRTQAQMIMFWHSGARKGKRRLCKCSLKKPSNMSEEVTMTIKWKSLGTIGGTEEDVYTMTKYETLSAKYDNMFEFKIGLARHEYFDAMLALAKMKYPQLKEKRFESLCKLCEEYLIPYIWGSKDNAKASVIKAIFRPHSTELHKLFGKYNSIKQGKKGKKDKKGSDDSGTDKSLLGLDVWKVLCTDILKQDKNGFHNGGKPSESDINASFQLAKEKYEIALNYRGFEHGLQNLAKKMYKKKPKAKYKIMPFNDKLKKLCKWSVKLQKSGHTPVLKKSK